MAKTKPIIKIKDLSSSYGGSSYPLLSPSSSYIFKPAKSYKLSSINIFRSKSYKSYKPSIPKSSYKISSVKYDPYKTSYSYKPYVPPYKYPPYKPRTPMFPGFPPTFPKGMGKPTTFFRKPKRKVSKRLLTLPTKYTPSFSALALGIKGKMPKQFGKLGYLPGIRPILITPKPKVIRKPKIKRKSKKIRTKKKK